jgi:hypothetical protein
VGVVRALNNGGSPWLLHAGQRRLVLRTGTAGDADPFAVEAAGLRLAAQAGIPAPRLLGHDDGTVTGVPVLLATCLPGASTIPARSGWPPWTPYWDIVAALATPPQLGWFPPTIAAQGRPDLTRDLLLRRHEEFLAAALERLPSVLASAARRDGRRAGRPPRRPPGRPPAVP